MAMRLKKCAWCPHSKRDHSALAPHPCEVPNCDCWMFRGEPHGRTER